MTAPLRLIVKKTAQSSSGFTIIELLTVLVIMVLLATAMLVNLAGQRAPRDMRIAENELVTNIRKAQSYTLSSRLLPSGNAPQYYVLKFNLAKPSQYTIQAMYNVSSSPQLVDVETVQLPTSVKISGITISGRSAAPATQSSTTCALAAFATPYGKVIVNDGCVPLTPGASPYTILSSDDYQKIINFQTNVKCTDNLAPPPASCSASTDSIFTITLTSKTSASLQKQVILNAITGAVTFN